MTNSKMPIQSATITVTGTGASGTPIQVYDASGLIPNTESAFVIPPGGSFTFDITTSMVFPFESQTLGGGCPEWITLEDVTEGGTQPAIRVKGTVPGDTSGSVVSGGVTFTVNAAYDGIEYTFPAESAPVSLSIGSVASAVTLTLEEGGPLGLGFFNGRRLIMEAEFYRYTPGGIPIPFYSKDFKFILLCATAKGGVLGHLNLDRDRILLFNRNGEEADGLLQDVCIVLIGTTKVN